jgi:uncharacterized damage-inducible protein DinB
MNNLQYPIGECNYPEIYTPELIAEYILNIETFPTRLEYTVQQLNEDQLHVAYRDGGWTINQVIHHCADSHMNCLIRTKLTLSEDNPIVKPYDEAKWAEMVDYDLPFNNSLVLLHAVHKKIVTIFKSLNEEDLDRKYTHPQYMREFQLKELLCLYSWHGNHHLAHITSLMDRMGWKS